MAIKRLPDAELEVMQAIWALGGESTSAQIIARLEGKKDWAKTTVLNFLIRLTDRGFIATRRQGKGNIYTPVIDEETYLAAESASFLQRVHGNSITSLVTALYGGKAISNEDLDELQQFINDRGAGDGR